RAAAFEGDLLQREHASVDDFGEAEAARAVAGQARVTSYNGTAALEGHRAADDRQGVGPLDTRVQTDRRTGRQLHDPSAAARRASSDRLIAAGRLYRIDQRAIRPLAPSRRRRNRNPRPPEPSSLDARPVGVVSEGASTPPSHDEITIRARSDTPRDLMA